MKSKLAIQKGEQPKPVNPQFFLYFIFLYIMTMYFLCILAPVLPAVLRNRKQSPFEAPGAVFLIMTIVTIVLTILASATLVFTSYFFKNYMKNIHYTILKSFGTISLLTIIRKTTNVVESKIRTNVTMADKRTMAQMLEAPIEEAHSSPFPVHPGSMKMYHDLKQHFWWSGMKRDVATFVSRCLVCQQVKIEHQRASGLLQPLDIPVWKWDEISMDFVTGLPQTQRRHDAIWVVVDRFPIRKDYSVSRLAEIFQQEIVRLHGTPSAIVSDRDPRFASRFWKGLQKAWGTRLKFSTAFHPQTDGQIEFAYNNSWHANIKCAPFKMLYGRKCRALICWDQVGERVIEGPEKIEVTNAKVAVAKEKLKEARTRQKSYADKHRRSLEFQPGDHVFLKVSPTRGVRRFGIKGNLSPHFIRPFEILDRVSEVSYRLALPPQLSHVHNVFYVSLFRGYKYHPLHVILYPLDQIRTNLSYVEEPEAILDRQDRVMRKKTIPFVKILWRNHPEREAT
nr:putative nucleotidyltransferase, ribonuclease H [Tanacetum cinerariifolium]